MLDQIQEIELEDAHEEETQSEYEGPTPDIVELEPSATTGGTVGTDTEEQHDSVQSNQSSPDIAEVEPPRSGGDGDIDNSPTAQVQSIDASVTTGDADGDSQNEVGVAWENPQPDVVEVEDPMVEATLAVEWKESRVISGTPDTDIVDLVLPSRGPTVEGSAASQDISEGSSKDTIGSGETTDVGEQESVTPDVVEIEVPSVQGMVAVKAPSGPEFSFDVSDDDESDMDLDL